ncbi:MAG TPA: glycoside hydrolase family 1 protein [Solirubrobacterales bacterium]|jgi:beta-glucosidase/6-phospho-beta-glucosidase/beta-galactosidase|nr:glycoside hydrolase family 1 protein [Solirubrobacterales bacterium]
MRHLRLAGLAAIATLAVAAPSAAAAATPPGFPASFLWGTASAGFQSEAGGSPANVDRRSDWWAFTTDPELIADGLVSGDSVADGPGFLHAWRGDFNRARRDLSNNAIRLGIEWSRIFPRSTARIDTARNVSIAELRKLDAVADQSAVRRYRRILAGARDRGLEVMLTLNHFTLPIWIHDPASVRAAFAGRGSDDPVPADLRRAGWLNRSTVGEFRKYAAYAAWKFRRQVGLWATLNEPMITVSQGFVSIPGVTGVKAPGILSYPAALRAVENLGLANAAAYDAIHAHDPRARVGFVHNMVDWRPFDPGNAADVVAAGHVDQILNRAYIEIAINGWYDRDADGVEDPGEVRPKLRDKADFVGVNHYSPGRAQALGFPVSSTIPLFDFLPHVTYEGTGNPGGEPCPTTCSDFGWEIDPAGLRNVVAEAAAYGKPVYVTENGIDDADDDQRRSYIRGYLGALQDAIAGGADVRGYFYWSLTDNYEWAEGFRAHFGLYGFDPETLKRRLRPSARLYGRIARAGAVPGS